MSEQVKEEEEEEEMWSKYEWYLSSESVTQEKYKQLHQQPRND